MRLLLFPLIENAVEFTGGPGDDSILVAQGDVPSAVRRAIEKRLSLDPGLSDRVVGLIPDGLVVPVGIHSGLDLLKGWWHAFSRN